jgi:uncharacterized 2Fe-2S/4Fe-4S cluster protein (DUF4445 family)
MSAKNLRIQLEPLSVVVEAPAGSDLANILAPYGFEFPCGGNGLCSRCRVRVITGSLPVTAEDNLAFSAKELADGWRLACQAQVNTPLVLDCGQWHMDVLTDDTDCPACKQEQAKHGLGIAIDLGTTTLAAQMVDMATGSVLGIETDMNPQAIYGSDVMSRIRAALSGADLTTVIRLNLRQLILKLAGARTGDVVEIVLVGNTVMHHLFSGLDVEPLSHTPFHPPHMGEQRFTPPELDWPLPASCRVRFLPCLGGFVGSDILAGLIAVGMPSSDALIALVDLGTNGEIAIGNSKGVFCASTAAGPAFEAGAIRMGMRAVNGAISRVSCSGNRIHATVVGGGEARGICGSGLVDAVAVGVESGAILSSGRIANKTKLFPVCDPVALLQSDIRELQLAKAAIASGFRLLLKQMGAGIDDLQCIYLAGAFGNYVQVDSALCIGMLEAPKQRIQAAGNTALRGARMILLSPSVPALPAIKHISLAADPGFQDAFVACMTFPART